MTRLLASLVAVVLLLPAGCTGEGPDRAEDTGAASSTPTTTPLPARPKVGECRRLTLEQAVRETNQADPVPCRRPHTAVTVHVGRLASVVPASVEVGSVRGQRRLGATCRERMARFLGGTAGSRTLSRFQVVWFVPTVEERTAGAGWFHCDVLALDRGERLMRLPGPERLRGVLDRPGALGTYGLCGTAAPGSRNFERVACARRHSWVAIGTITLDGGRRYPGAAAVRQAGDDACADRVRAERGFPVQFRYGWEWPTRAQWEAGQRHGLCWAPA